MNKWELLNSEKAFESKYITIKKNTYKLPDGTIGEDYFHMERPDYVLIIGINKTNQILVEKQYRRGINDFVYELPAGWLNEKEIPEETALRELLEETGYTGEAKLLTTIYPQPGFSSMKAHLVLIKINQDNPTQSSLEKDEDIEYQFLNQRDIDKLILNGTIKDMGMLAALNIVRIHNNSI